MISVLLIDKINFYMLLITVLLMNNYANNITDNIVHTKMKLQQEIKIVTQLKPVATNDVVLFENFRSISEVDTILSSVVDILKGIEAFNKIYGIQILGISSIIMLYITDTFNTIFYFVEYQTLTLEIIFMKCYNSFILLIFGMLMVSPCFETNKQFDEVIKVTCKFLIELPHGLEDPYSKLLKEKLVLLIKQLEFRKPYFSAAGFFEVNYGMFMYIFAGITSFVVVYVQLQIKFK
ncbi:hypothetical protein NQ314_002053 [Rhamnusium bicolor]|uniref:Gustatory receptor n=1 Tax=Rhamnusium bicolor TaxID=1586634 RepID=A0AAV8ZQV5_9CUCU|nr:hypothetical protein NQ314_002053 [Rhamnusium bicolor]